MVLRAMLIGGLIVGLMGLAQNVWQFLGLRILQGAFTGTVAASTALVATSVPRDRLAQSIGLLQTGAYLGIAGGPVLGGVIAEAVGIRGTFVVAGAMLAGAGVSVWLFVHEHFEPQRGGPQPSFFQSLAAGITSRDLMPLLVVQFLIQFSSGLIVPILPLVVEHLAAGAGPVRLYAGLAFGTTAVFSALSAMTYSRIVDRGGYRRVLIFAGLGAAILFVPQAYAQTILQLLLLRAALGIFFGALVPTSNGLIAIVTPKAIRGSAYGVTSSAMALGTAAGPLLGATLAASFGLSSIFLAAAAALTMLGLWVVALVREPTGAGTLH